jgi:hypothetical protein
MGKRHLEGNTPPSSPSGTPPSPPPPTCGSGTNEKPPSSPTGNKGCGKGSGKGGGKGSGSTSRKCNDVETICNIWKVFDTSSHENHKDEAGVFDWQSVCNEFDPVDYIVCPSSDILEDICDRPDFDRNPAVNQTYCQPLVADLPDGEFKDACVLHCVNYVSKFRGDCCAFECKDY